jgi:hypothetical protein
LTSYPDFVRLTTEQIVNPLPGGAKMDRARFIEHRGRQIFLLDCRDCKPDEISTIIAETARQVRSQPHGSVRTVTVAGGGSRFEHSTILELKDLTKGNAPYVDRAAVVGISGLYKVVLMTVSTFSKRQFHLFDTLEEALDFLAAD